MLTAMNIPYDNTIQHNKGSFDLTFNRAIFTQLDQRHTIILSNYIAFNGTFNMQSTGKFYIARHFALRPNQGIHSCGFFVFTPTQHL